MTKQILKKIKICFKSKQDQQKAKFKQGQTSN
jgi:hypothetical protein